MTMIVYRNGILAGDTQVVDYVAGHPCYTDSKLSYSSDNTFAYGVTGQLPDTNSKAELELYIRNLLYWAIGLNPNHHNPALSKYENTEGSIKLSNDDKITFIAMTKDIAIAVRNLEIHIRRKGEPLIIGMYPDEGYMLAHTFGYQPIDIIKKIRENTTYCNGNIEFINNVNLLPFPVIKSEVKEEEQPNG